MKLREKIRLEGYSYRVSFTRLFDCYELLKI